MAAWKQKTNLHFLSQYRGFRGNRVEMVAWTAQELLANNRGDPSWGLVAALVTFAGTLLERPPREVRRRKKTENEDVSRDCRFLVALLCAQLSGRHRAWLMANGGWVSAAGAGTRGGWAARDAPTRPAPGGTLRRQPRGAFVSAGLGHSW